MNTSILMQKQIKDNADDLQKEILDMKNWEEQMKRKDEELKKESCNQVILPSIRSKHKNKTQNAPTKQNGIDAKSKRIKSYDYSAWEKFDVDKACEDIDNKEQTNDSEGESMSKEELEKAHEKATKHKNEGNILVQQQKWPKAIGCYSEAIKIFPYDAVFYANRGLCQLKLENFYSAESDCSAAIQLDETYVKAYHRRATARMNLKQYKEAKSDLEKVLKLEPSNKETKLLLNQVESKIKLSEKSTAVKEETEKSPEKSVEKKIAKKMWGNTVLNVQTDTKDKEEIKYKKNEGIENIVNRKNNIEDKKDNVADTIIKKKKDPRIPDWLPEKDDVTVIEPIEKPPHLRSKKSLTKIPIEEVDFNTIQYKYNNTKIICSKGESIEKEEASKNSIYEQGNSVKVSESPKDTSTIPPVPKTAVQFVMNWTRNKLSDFRYKYLKQLPENSLPKIFQDSMESDIFTQILEVLRTEFIKYNDPIFHYLKDLGEVKRFKTLIMFMSKNDKEGLKTLFEHCRTFENVSEDEILVLQNKYEI